MNTYAPSINLSVGDSLLFKTGEEVRIITSSQARPDEYRVAFDDHIETWHIDEFEKRIKKSGGALIRVEP